jgi:hypothetical protein
LAAAAATAAVRAQAAEIDRAALAETALALAKAGASHADIRINRYDREFVGARGRREQQALERSFEQFRFKVGKRTWKRGDLYARR